MHVCVGMQAHPFAECVPFQSPPEYAALCESLRADGFHSWEPVLIYQDQILDGRHRYKAAIELGLTPVCAVFDGDDDAAKRVVLASVVAHHNLSESQRALVVRLLVTTEVGVGEGQKKSDPGRISSSVSRPMSQPEAAALGDVSPRTLQRINTALDKKRGAPELEAYLRAGTIDAKPAAAIAKLPEERREQVLAAIDSGVKPALALRRASRAVVRETNAAQELTGKWSLVYADPPWQYTNDTVSGAAEDHYPTMSTEDICAMPVADRVTDNAVLLLWVTNPMLKHGLAICEAWGFTYQTQYVWLKNRGSAVGYHVRSRTEMLWVCTRGTGMTIPMDQILDNVIEAPVTKHSAKPLLVYEMIEQLYPEHRKLEMFCRARREGWDAFGNAI